MNSIKRNPFQAESMLRATSAYKSAHHHWRGLEGFQICLGFSIKWMISGVSIPLPLPRCYCVFFCIFPSYGLFVPGAVLEPMHSFIQVCSVWFCVCRHHLCLVHGWEVRAGSSLFTPSYAVLLATFYTAHWGITFPSTEPPSHGPALWPASCMCGDRFLCHLQPVWILVLHGRGSKEGKTRFYKFLGFFTLVWWWRGIFCISQILSGQQMKTHSGARKSMAERCRGLVSTLALHLWGRTCQPLCLATKVKLLYLPGFSLKDGVCPSWRLNLSLKMHVN